jgi:hypothetical protein
LVYLKDYDNNDIKNEWTMIGSRQEASSSSCVALRCFALLEENAFFLKVFFLKKKRRMHLFRVLWARLL